MISREQVLNAPCSLALTVILQPGFGLEADEELLGILLPDTGLDSWLLRPSRFAPGGWDLELKTNAAWAGVANTATLFLRKKPRYQPLEKTIVTGQGPISFKLEGPAGGLCSCSTIQIIRGGCVCGGR